MRLEVITERPDLRIQRLVLEPGEATHWHTDLCHRFSVVVRGERLTIEYLDGSEPAVIGVHPGMAEWDAPDARVHRGVNTGASVYEEVVTFWLPSPGIEPQPGHAKA